METQLKEEVLKEMQAHGGKLLLHDEMETKPGVFEVVPIWEEVDELDILTPKELYQRVTAESYHVDYLRIAIVCSV